MLLNWDPYAQVLSLGPELRGHDLVVELEDCVKGEGNGEATQHGEHQHGNGVVQDLVVIQ